MKIEFLGHAAFRFQTASHTLLVDPFLTGNPQARAKAEEVSGDFILLTHGHADHFGDTEAIGKRCGATVIANFELASFCESKGLAVHPMHIGGGADFPFGRLKLTIAHHGSSYPGEDGLPIYLGEPAGFVLTADGTTVYHAGDTGLFLDMQLIAERNPVDVAILPIGDNFTMGVDDALKAVEFIKPRVVIPMHYNTWPPIEADAAAFARGVEERGAVCHVLAAGGSVDI